MYSAATTSALPRSPRQRSSVMQSVNAAAAAGAPTWEAKLRNTRLLARRQRVTQGSK
jgi:hypothetical protein